MTLRLDIHADGVTYPYPDAVITDGAVTTSERISGGRIERGAIRLTLLVGAMLGGDWLGAVPPGETERGEETWRARVVATSGGAETVLLDGTVRAASMAHGRPFDEASGVRRWTVEVEDSALAVLLDRLAAVPVQALAGSTTTASLGADLGAGATSVYAHRLLDLLAQAATAAGTDAAPVTLDAAAALFGVRVPYLAPGSPSQVFTSVPDVVLFDHDPDRVGEATRTGLPRMTGSDLVDLAQALSGGVLSAQYAPYPSRAIVATLASPRPSGAPAAALDLVVEDYDIAIEDAAEPDLAVVYEGSLSDASGVDLVARYAAERWSLVPRPREEGDTGDAVLEPGNASVMQIPARLPSASSTFTATRTHGEGLSAYTETLTLGYAVLDEAGLYVARRDETGALVAYAEPASPAPTTPYPVYGDLWAAAVLARRVERQSHLVATATAPRSQLAAAPRVGTWALSLDGQPFRLRSVEIDHDAGTVAIEMERPLRATVDLLVPARRAPVLVVYRLSEVDGIGDTHVYADASAVLPYGSLPGTVEIDRSLDGGATWMSHTERVETSAPVDFRARALYSGSPGPYVTATLA